MYKYSFTSVDMADKHKASADLHQTQVTTGMNSSDNPMMAILIRLESKVDNMRRDILTELDTRLKKIQDDIFLEIAGLRARIEEIELKITEPNNSRPDKQQFDPERSVIIFGLHETVSEDITNKISSLIKNGLKLPDVVPLASKRLQSRNDKPGAVKVEFKDLDDKVKALRAKQKLKEQRLYRNVYIRSSKSHMERLHEINMRMLLDEVSDSSKFGFTGSGKMYKKTPEQIAKTEDRKRTRSQISSTSSVPGTTPKPAKQSRSFSQVLSENIDQETVESEDPLSHENNS